MSRQNSAASMSTAAPPGHPTAPFGLTQGPYASANHNHNHNVNPGSLTGLGGPGGPMPGGSMPGSIPGGPMPIPMQGSLQNGPMPGGGGGAGPHALYYTPAGPGTGTGRGMPIGPGGVPMQMQMQGMGRGVPVNGQPGQAALTVPMPVRYITGPQPMQPQRLSNGMTPMGRGAPGQGPGQPMTINVGPGGVRMARPLPPSHPQYAQFPPGPQSGQPHMLIPQQQPPPSSSHPGQSAQAGGQPQPPPGQQRYPVFSQQMAMGPMGVAQLAQMGTPMQMAPGQLGPTPQQLGGQPSHAMQMGQPPMGGQQMGGQSMNSMNINPMTNLMSGGASPQRNPSPLPNSGNGSASGTPARAPTPGKRGTPVNAPTPGRPSTSTQSLTFPSHHHQQTPRLQSVDMSFPNPQTSPRQTPRNGPPPPPGSLPPQGGPGGLINPSVLRATPAQTVEHAAGGIYGPGPGGGGGYTMYTTQPGQSRVSFSGGLQSHMTQPPPMGSQGPLQPQQTGPLQPQHTGQGPGPGPGQQLQQPSAPLQPQHTGGSMHDQPMQSLQPQHTGGGGGGGGGGQPLAPQHTGGSMHGPGRGSVPSTPSSMAARPPGMIGGMGMPGGMTMGVPLEGFPLHMPNPMGPPLLRPGLGPGGPTMNHAMSGMMMRGIPSELEAVNDMTMEGMGLRGLGPERPREHAFGVLRLLDFSREMGNPRGVSGYFLDRVDHSDTFDSAISTPGRTSSMTISRRTQPFLSGLSRRPKRPRIHLVYASSLPVRAY